MEHDQFTSLLDLPNEVLEKIVSYLPASAIYKNLRLTCQRLLDLCNSERFCQNEVIVFDINDPVDLSVFENSTRGCFNLIFELVNLDHEQVSTFLEQHGVKVRSLTFNKCKKPPNLLEMIVKHCETLCSLSIDDEYNFNHPPCTFSLIDPKLGSRPTVTFLKLPIMAEIIMQPSNVYLQMLLLFPCLKHLDVTSVKSSQCRDGVQRIQIDHAILDFVMNFNQLEVLKLSTDSKALLIRGPEFLDMLPKLKEFHVPLGDYETKRDDLWENFSSRLNVSSLILASNDLKNIVPLVKVTGLNHLELHVNTISISLETFEALVASPLKILKIEYDAGGCEWDTTEKLPIEANETVTDLIINALHRNYYDPIKWAVFPTYFHGLVHLSIFTTSDGILQSIFKYQKNLRSLILGDCYEFCSVAGFCGTVTTVDQPSTNSITNLQKLEHLEIWRVDEDIIQSRNFQMAFNFPRLKYLAIATHGSQNLRIPVNMFKTCVSLEALRLSGFSYVPPSIEVSTLLQNSEHLNYLGVVNDFQSPSRVYVNLKHFYSVDLQKLQSNNSPETFYYDEVIDRTVFTERTKGKTIRLHSPKISSHEVKWIKTR